MDLPDSTNGRKRSPHSAASSPSPGPSRSSARSTPYSENTGRKRVRREEESRVDVATRRSGHTYSHGYAKDSARVQYGDQYSNVYNYNGQSSASNRTHEQDTAAQIMESLGFAQMDTRRDTISRNHMNTCKWLFDKQEYRDWRDMELMPTHGGFFWIKSKPGAGKSTLMKFMVKSAKRRMPHDTIISFFFNARGGVALETSLEGMYRSLLHQLLIAYPGLQTSSRLSKISNCGQQDWQVSTLESLFHDAVLDLEHGQSHLTCFIDALDECPEDDVRALLKSLGHLSYSAQEDGIDLHICFSSRHYPHITFERCQHLILEGQEGHEHDISTYVNSELVGTGKMIGDMKLEIQQRAQGVFLWAELVVQILNKDCDRGNLKRLRDRLNEIPDGLDDLFQDILRRGIQENSRLVQVLQWIMFAQRPLTPKELYLAVHSGTSDCTHLKPWDDEEIEPRSIDLFILDSSKGLAEMTKGTKRQKSTVQFIHESVRDYLRKTGFGVLAPDLVGNLAATTHAYLYRCCCQWISHDVIKHLSLPKGLPKAKSPEAKQLRDNASVLFPFLEYCVSNMVHHAEMACSQAISQVDFVKTFPRSLWLIINNVFAIHDTRRHVASSDALLCILSSKNAPGLLAHELQSRNFFLEPTHEVEESLRLAIVFRNQEALAVIFSNIGTLAFSTSVVRKFVRLALEKCDVGALEIISQHCAPPKYSHHELELAIRSKNVHFVRTFLQWIGQEAAPQHTSMWSSLFDSVACGQAAMVQLLLDHSRLFTNVQWALDTLLLSAASKGHADIVQILLLHGADAEHEMPDRSFPTALLEACAAGRTTAVKVLLEHGAAFDSPEYDSLIPLVIAAERGHSSVVHLLLQHGAVIDRINSSQSTALEVACFNGHVSVVGTLLKHGADANPGDKGLRSPLFQACFGGGNRNILQLLIAHGAGVDVRSASPNGSCHEASANELGALVRKLLDNGADSHTIGEELLRWLSRLHHTDRELIVQFFASEDRANNGRSLAFKLLSMASISGLDNIVQNLFRDGLKINALEYFEALAAAARLGHGLVVKALIANDTGFSYQPDFVYSMVARVVTMGRHGYVLELLLDQSKGFRAQGRHTFAEALHEAMRLGFGEIVQILRQRGVTLPEDRVVSDPRGNR